VVSPLAELVGSRRDEERLQSLAEFLDILGVGVGIADEEPD